MKRGYAANTGERLKFIARLRRALRLELKPKAHSSYSRKFKFKWATVEAIASSAECGVQPEDNLERYDG